MANPNVLGEFEAWSKNMPRAELGGLIKEYLAESNHGGWDGFRSSDMTGIKRFLADLMVYHGNNKTDFAHDINNVNPVL